MEAQPPEIKQHKEQQQKEETRGLDHRQIPEVSTPGEPLRRVLMSKRWEW